MVSTEVQNIFADIIDRAKALDPVNTRQWFNDLKPVSMDRGSLKIGCPEEPQLQYLEEFCKSNFTRAAQQITGHLVTVDFLVSDGQITQKDKTVTTDPLRLHPDYTFENFVVGPSNRLAHASCIAVSNSPGNTYNPLFLYGNSGLGKTHLLHAVCSETRKRNQNAVICMLSCENFVNRFIRAIEEGNVLGFQSQFRSVDTLVIDDIQFLSDREQSQEEFFHTFNALYNNGKQIILTADSSPTEMKSLEERLISRFNWGLVTRIDAPSFDTRVAIVKKKAHLRGLNISDGVAEYIAGEVRANIRELEGALTTIYAVATTIGSDITLEIAKTALGGQLMTSSKQISITDIIDVVTQHFDVRLADLQSKKRSQSITLPRQICMFLARDLTRHSLEEIGGHLGGRDHTTVMHACSKITQLKETDPQFNKLLSDLTRKINHPGQ